jgi:microcystin-dependent protein
MIMSEPFIGEVSMIGFDFAPRGWAFCDGQLLPIAQYTALYSLLGTTYGGDGRTTFALPDLRGRTPIHPGRGPGLSDRRLGQQVGSETVTVTTAQIPSHTHTLKASSQRQNTSDPSNNVLAQQPVEFYDTPQPNDERAMHAGSIANTGGGQAHTNRQPYQAVRFIIALQGLFPSRS